MILSLHQRQWGSMHHLTHQALKLGTWYAKGGDSANVPDLVCPKFALSSAAKELEAHGYVTLLKSLTGPVVVIEEKCAQLGTGRVLRDYRKSELALRVLDWVDEHPDNAKAVHDLAATLNEDHTGDFTTEDFLETGNRLLERGYLTGVKAWGGAIVRPRLTPEGERYLNHGDGSYNVGNYGRIQVNNYHTQIHGDVHNLQQGDQNVMNATHVNDVDKLLKQMRDLVPESAPEAQQHMGEIEAEVRSTSVRSSAVKALVTALATTVGTSAGQQIAMLGEQLIGVIQQA